MFCARICLALTLSLGAGAANAATVYWSLFNIEGESSITADYVTYASLMDMLTDTNRTGNFSPDNFGAGRNVIGSGSDGSTYWSLFNIEGESSITADYVTYASLMDMLTDTNRTGNFSGGIFGAGRNIVGSGSDGSTYWSLFNIEGETSISADYVTYASLMDMLTDTNRTGVFSPDNFDAGRNVVVSGASIIPASPPPQSPPAVIPLPAGPGMLASALAALGLLARRRGRWAIAAA